jgi:malonyl-CoA O-methyltransferase
MPEARYAHTVRRRFSRAGPHYDSLAGIQRRVIERLLPLLGEAHNPERVLEAGCGSGQLTLQIAERFPNATIDAVDIAGGMIATLEAKQIPNTRFHVSDAAIFQGTDPYDLIASSSSLHWMTPIDQTLRSLAHQLRPGGQLLIAVMLDGTLGELRSARLRVAPHKPPLGSLPNATCVREAVTGAGLDIYDCMEEVLTDHYPSAEAFLRHIHAQGLTGGSVSRARQPLTRSELQQLVKQYQASYGKPDGTVSASYRLIYLAATQPASPPS